jgi:aldose 1-epimerase
MSIERANWGQHDGQTVEHFTLTNERGHSVGLTNYGAAVTSVVVPDRQGRLADVVLGFEQLDAYVQHSAFFGATVGRVANRIRNATFQLVGRRIQLAATDGAHHLHGGRRGWDRVVWSAALEPNELGPALELSYTSADGEEGYPGRVVARVRYIWTHENALIVDMRAHADDTTIVNMAHHSYWNLAGHSSGEVLSHELELSASRYTPADPVVPIGKIEPCLGTAFDFTRAKAIGLGLEQLRSALPAGEPGGFDHNWVVDGEPGRMRRVARLYHAASGRRMTLESDAPGVQFYSGNFLDGSLSGKGARYGRHAGLCLETQAFPNAVNVPAWASQVIVPAGQTYRHQMMHQFAAE